MLFCSLRCHAAPLMLVRGTQTAFSMAGKGGEILGLLANGYATERFGARITLITALASIIGFIFLQVFAQNVEMLIAASFLTGASWGVFETGTVTYAAELAPVALRSSLTAYVNLCWVRSPYHRRLKTRPCSPLVSLAGHRSDHRLGYPPRRSRHRVCSRVQAPVRAPGNFARLAVHSRSLSLTSSAHRAVGLAGPHHHRNPLRARVSLVVRVSQQSRVRPRAHPQRACRQVRRGEVAKARHTVSRLFTGATPEEIVSSCPFKATGLRLS